MTITSRTPLSSTVPPRKILRARFGPRTSYSTKCAGRTFPSGHEVPAKEQFSTSVLGIVGGPMREPLARPHEVHDGVSAGGEELRDEAAVTSPPERLGAHEEGCGLGERLCERLWPLALAQAGRVAPKSGRA